MTWKPCPRGRGLPRGRQAHISDRRPYAKNVGEIGCEFMPERLLVRTGSGTFWMKEFTESCQIGIVIIQDDVEIGANVTIDRGALGPTVIGKGSKFDNLSSRTQRVDWRKCA